MDTRQLNPGLISSQRPWLRGNVLGLASVDVGSCPTGTNVSDIGKGLCTKLLPRNRNFPHYVRECPSQRYKALMSIAWFAGGISRDIQANAHIFRKNVVFEWSLCLNPYVHGEGHSVKKASFATCCRAICKTARFDIILAKIKTFPFIAMYFEMWSLLLQPLAGSGVVRIDPLPWPDVLPTGSVCPLLA